MKIQDATPSFWERSHRCRLLPLATLAHSMRVARVACSHPDTNDHIKKGHRKVTFFNVVGLEGKTSNQLFDELARWNEYLETEFPELKEPQP